MTERDYMKKLEKLMNGVPGCVMRVMPDSGTCSHKKPYDAFIIYKGVHISIEGKMTGGVLEPHQKKALYEDMQAGAPVVLAWFSSVGVKFTDVDDRDGVTMPWGDFKIISKKKDILENLFENGVV